mgnify:CR=1 FL=1
MKKLAVILLGAFFLTGFLTVSSMAKGPSKKAGNSNIGHLYLYEKEPDPAKEREDPWLIVPGGAWGKMKYNLSGPTFDFVFNGHGLVQLMDYTLIYYPDPWPAYDLICLGSGIATERVECDLGLYPDCMGDDGGNVHIAGSVDTGDLPMPIETDENYADGAKIFLVPSADVACESTDDIPSQMVGWTGDDVNLYEDVLIIFDDTDNNLPTE